ncbi:MAG: CRTAC1 family protein [Planctomycetota bacterium]|nr:CRTAC1 family protein [Planctomycetota bacterium]
MSSKETPAFATATAFLFLAASLDAQEVSFVDVTERTGIDFVHRSGSRQKDWIAEVNGSGVALFDADADGDLDIYLVNASVFGDTASPPRNALYRNDGNWRFRDVTRLAGVGDTGWGSGAAVADVDNDGHLDLYVTNRGPNVLYRNRGDGSFERLRGAGCEDPSWSASASFADLDRDGLVDLYVANYVRFEKRREKRRGSASCVYKGVRIFCGPGGLEPAPDRVFRNEGGGRFRDVTNEWGFATASPSYGLGTLVVDLERDGLPDVLVANDTMKNFCFANQGDGKGPRFVEAGLFLGLAYNDYGVEQAGMGLASGDVRRTGRSDVFVTNFEDDTNTLYLEQEGGFFVEGTFPAGLGTPSYPCLGWGCFFFDAEGDGDLDLFVANGHVAPQVDDVRSSAGYRQPNQLFLNDGRGRFREDPRFRREASARRRSSRGAAFGDLDGDGDPDVVVSNIDAAPTILENRSRRANVAWLEIQLRGAPSNRAAIGARVHLQAGHRREERYLQSGMSFASQCELAARFALDADVREAIVRVDWPSGLRESFPIALGTGSRHRVLLREGDGQRLDK